MNMKTTFFVAMAIVLAAALPIRAHHAFGGEFDANRPVLLKGSVVKVEWVNPHAWIHIAVKQPDGKSEVWMIEGGSPNSLLRQGVTKASLPVGTEIVVDGYQARDHTLKRANGRNITYPTDASCSSDRPEPARRPMAPIRLRRRSEDQDIRARTALSGVRRVRIRADRRGTKAE
jgi:hypothetical protein